MADSIAVLGRHHTAATALSQIPKGRLDEERRLAAILRRSEKCGGLGRNGLMARESILGVEPQVKQNREGDCQAGTQEPGAGHHIQE